MEPDSTQQYYAHSVSHSPSNQSQNSQPTPQIVNTAPASMNPQQPLPDNPQYTAYMQHQQQRQYYAQQQYLAQRQYAAYWQSMMRQRQQNQYAHYYQQVAQQYGYPAMVQAMNQMNPNHTMNPNYMPNPHAHEQRPSAGPIILSSEEQPALIAPDNERYKKRRRRKRKKPEPEDTSNDDVNASVPKETVSIDIADDEGLGLDKDGYDRHTLINQNEVLPDMETEFDEWLYFTKKLWKRQRKYKDGTLVVHTEQKQSINEANTNKKDVLDLTESLSISDDSSPAPADALQIRSSFLQDRVRMNHKRPNVLKNKRVVNIMIRMGLAPPWNQMTKYTKWNKCYQDMFD